MKEDSEKKLKSVFRVLSSCEAFPKLPEHLEKEIVEEESKRLRQIWTENRKHINTKITC